MLRSETRHALRSLAALASDPGPLTIGALSRRLRAPAPVLGQVLCHLARLGFVSGQRGPGGGYRLARPAAAIGLAQVVDALEGPGFARACLFGLSRCSDRQPCPLHDTWAGVRERLLGAFTGTTVADLSANRDRQKRVRGSRPRPARQTKGARG